MQRYYSVCNIPFSSTISFPELQEQRSCCSQEVIQLLNISPPETSSSIDWYHHWGQKNGNITLQFGSSIDYYHLVFPKLATFTIQKTFKKVFMDPSPELPEHTLRHLFLDQVFPLMLHSIAGPVIHASAVQQNSGINMFVGETGMGKSSLAFIFSKKNQGKFISDDFILLQKKEGNFFTRHSYSSIRLYPEVANRVAGESVKKSSVAHYTKKMRIDAQNSREEKTQRSIPLSRIFLIQKGSRVDIQKVSSQKAFIKLNASLFVLDHRKQDLLNRDFEQIAELCQRTPIYSLSIPHPVDYYERDLITLFSEKFLDREIGEQETPSSS